MTGTDLIVLAPWIAFAVGLAAICLLLLRSRGASGLRSRRASGLRPRGRRPGPPAVSNPEETRCPEKNAQ
jgi:hypothetical protein